MNPTEPPAAPPPLPEPESGGADARLARFDGWQATPQPIRVAPSPRPSRLPGLLRFLLGVVLSGLLAAGLVLAVLYLAPPAVLRRDGGAPPIARATAPPLAAPRETVALPPPGPAAVLAPLDDAIARIYDEVGPSVVNLTTTAYAYDFFRFAVVPQQGSGSGFLIDDQGHIATNEHVIHDASTLEVTLADGTKLPGTLVGRDASNDLAVVRVDLPAGTSIRPIRFADSSTVRVGQTAIAIGNPFGFERTITTGVIGSVGRTLRTPQGRQMRGVLQTDAAINPGNSGGPLLNARGEAVGINTMIFSPSGGSVGVGFAIASNTARRWLPELVAQGHASHPWTGFQAQPLTPQVAAALRLPQQQGLLIAAVTPNGPAAQAGLRAGNRQMRVGNQQLVIGGDVVTAVDGRAVSDPDELDAYVDDNKRVGDIVRLDLLRDNQPVSVELRLGERPQ
ncbi:MAG TPA: trypsin-like peptidase domain-containing protein [Chloroflexota bacterium]|nr:trypsin-like peptidase domain-containing protein [Chloroflexota bacterium]